MLLVLDMTERTKFAADEVKKNIDLLIVKSQEADQIKFSLDFKDSGYKQERYDQIMQDIARLRQKINSLVHYAGEKETRKRKSN